MCAKPPVTWASFKILKPIESRVGAKLIPEVYENVTDPKQYEILEMSRISGFVDRAGLWHGSPDKEGPTADGCFHRAHLFGFDDEDDDF